MDNEMISHKGTKDTKAWLRVFSRNNYLDKTGMQVKLHRAPQSYTENIEIGAVSLCAFSVKLCVIYLDDFETINKICIFVQTISLRFCISASLREKIRF